MKKLLLAVIAVASAVGIGYAATMIGEAAYDRTDPDSNRKLIVVHNTDAVAHENGDIVVFVTGATLPGVDVSTTSSANLKNFAGIVYPNDLPASGYGTVMVYGYHPAVTIGVANSAGDCLGTSTTAEATTVTTTAGACVATALEATTSSTTVKAMVHAL